MSSTNSSGYISMTDINTVHQRGNNLNSYRGTSYYDTTSSTNITTSTFPSGAIAFQNFLSTANTAPGTKVILLTSGTSWTVPNDWNNSNNTIECVGGGISGQAGSSSSYGGGGGSYAANTNVSLTIGAAITYAIGSGSGGDTCFGGSTIATSLIAAEGGARPGGGTTAASIGQTEFAGGSAQPTTPVNSGGGGAAFFGGAGGNAPTTAGGTAGPGTRTSNPGGVAVTGGAGGGLGAAGSLYGGGGGKGTWGTVPSPSPKGSPSPFSNPGGAGAAGIIIISYRPRVFP